MRFLDHRKQLATGLLATGMACLAIWGIVGAVKQDRHERELVASGQCERVTETLFTPPPVAHSSCYGDEASRSCTTWYTQADPYLRTLWRCREVAETDKIVEFWRRSSEGTAR